MEEQEMDRVKFKIKDQVMEFANEEPVRSVRQHVKQIEDKLMERALDEATAKHAQERATQPEEEDDTRPAWKVALDNMSLSSQWDLQSLLGSLSEALSAVSVLVPSPSPPLPSGKSRASLSTTVRSSSKAPSELLAAARAAAAADEEAGQAGSPAPEEAEDGETPSKSTLDLPDSVGPGVYLRGAAMPNSPARGLSEWRRSHAPTVGPSVQMSKRRREAHEAANKIIETAANMAMRSREEELKRRRETRRELKRLKLVASKSAHKVVLPDEEGEQDQPENRGAIDEAVSQWSLANPSEELQKARKILRDIDAALDRVNARTRVLAWKQASVARPPPVMYEALEEEDEELGSTPAEVARRERARRWPVEHSPLRSMHQRRRASLLADERVLAIRNEIARRVARIEEAVSQDTLTPERLTYAYVVRKVRPVAGDEVVGVESPPAPPTRAAEEGEEAPPDLDAVVALIAAATDPALVDQVKSLTVPLPEREAGAVEEVASEEPPRTATATGDELSAPSSPLRRHRVRRHRARRSLRQRTSHAAPSRSSSSSTSSAASAGEGGQPVDKERALLRRILLRDDDDSPEYTDSVNKAGRKYVPMKVPFYMLPASTLQEMGMGRRLASQRTVKGGSTIVRS